MNEKWKNEQNELFLRAKLTCYHDVFGDTAARVGAVVESVAGIGAGLLLGDTEGLHERTSGARELSSDYPPELCGRTGLRWAQHGQVWPHRKWSRCASIHC